MCAVDRQAAPATQHVAADPPAEPVNLPQVSDVGLCSRLHQPISCPFTSTSFASPLSPPHIHIYIYVCSLHPPRFQGSCSGAARSSAVVCLPVRPFAPDRGLPAAATCVCIISPLSSCTSSSTSCIIDNNPSVSPAVLIIPYNSPSAENRAITR